jgi:ABC-type sulfate transport system permease subunit
VSSAVGEISALDYYLGEDILILKINVVFGICLDLIDCFDFKTQTLLDFEVRLNFEVRGVAYFVFHDSAAKFKNESA